MMISERGSLFVALLVCVCSTGCAESSEEIVRLGENAYSAGRLTQYQLPDDLREISGLALTDTGQVLAHNDEEAVIYRIEPQRGEVLGTFQLGARPVKDDFEGITTLGQRVFLINSRGGLYETRLPLLDEDADPGVPVVVDYRRYQVQLPCEVEGLATLSNTTLLAACKTLPAGEDALRVYAWSLDDEAYRNDPYLNLSGAAFAGYIDKPRKLRPAGIAVTDAGALILVGRWEGIPVLIEIDPSGQVTSLQRLPDGRRHPQPEGISLTRSRQLLIADEGLKSSQSRSRGRLSVYHPN